VQPPDNVGRDDHHRAPGKGKAGWQPVFREFRKFKFSGYIAIDVEGRDVPDLGAEVTRGKVFR